MRPAAAISITCLALASLSASPVWAQKGDDRSPSYSSLINIDSLIDNHVRFLARKYDLSDDQEAFTEEYLRTRADEFLSQHRDEMFDLVDRLFEVRAGGQITQGELVEWGKRAIPLYQEAKLLIVEGNAEWREVLTPEQQTIHDQDLELMYSQFEQTEDQLERIVTGQMTVDEFRRGPGKMNRSRPRMSAQRATPKPRATPQAATPAKPKPRRAKPEAKPARKPTPRRGAVKPGSRSDKDSKLAERIRQRAAQRRARGQERPSRGRSRSTRVDDNFASQWEKYVEDFISRYKLNEGQALRARAVLKDCQEQANRHMQRAQPRIEQLERRMAKAGSEEREAKLRERLDQQKQRLLKPIGDIFEQRLKPSLEKLPTRAQRAEVESGSRRGSDDDQKKPKRRNSRKPQPRQRK